MLSKLIISILSVFIIISNISLSYSNLGSLEIIALDVGQGDAILIRTPEGKLILIDGGPDPIVLEKITQVIPHHVRTIDLVILTHPDSDHLRGLVDIVDRYEVIEFFYAGSPKDTQTNHRFHELLEANNVKISRINSSSDFSFGCCIEIDFLWPEVGADLTQLETNDASVTFLLKYNDFTGFFGGDLSHEIEDQLEVPDLDLLKVSHHGSITSTSDHFLARTKPEIAIIPVGKDNDFGHPHIEIIERLNKYNISILRTDKLGNLSLLINSLSKVDIYDRPG